MVTQLPTDLNQLLGPIPAVGQEIELAGHGKFEILKHLLGHAYFGLKATASLDLLGMIEPSPEGQERGFIEQSREHPLMAKDVGQILGMIFIPGTPWNLFARFFHDRIIQEKKEERTGLNPQGVKELMQSRLQDLLHRPGVLSQKTGETGKRSLQEGTTKGLNHGRGVNLLAQLDEADNKRGEELERRT